jgi:capsular polysaccharide export protein
MQSAVQRYQMRRSFLVLQGTASPFFSRLATALNERGHAVRRVNFCGGDRMYAGNGEAWNYTGTVDDLPGWYLNVMQTSDFTDVLMFGDCREIHRHVHPLAEAKGMRVYVFEEGYVRPHWLTLEQYGVNGRSRLPRDPAWYLEQRETTPSSPPGILTGYNLYERAFHDILYRGANALYASRFSSYRSHRPRNGFLEYAGLAIRAMRQRQFHRDAQRVTNELLGSGTPYYIFPLQLNSDAQIVVHSPFGSVRQAIQKVLRSFASHAPENTWLVIKNHQLDTGLTEYRRYSQQLGRELGVSNRLRFIDAGHLPTLLQHARGAIVVNSTVGLSALHHRRPLIALGTAIYDMQGLTWQGDLDDFWTDAIPPDMALYQAFLDYILHHTQINGDFYTRSGIEMAVAGAVRRLEAVEHA